MKKILLIVPVIFILLACKKSDQKLNSLIFGTWETDPPFKDSFLGGAWGDILNKKKYVFHRPNYCDTYYYDDGHGYLLSQDSLTFNISDKKLYLYDRSGISITNFTILKLNDTELKVRYSNDEEMKFDKIK